MVTAQGEAEILGWSQGGGDELGETGVSGGLKGDLGSLPRPGQPG